MPILFDLLYLAPDESVQNKRAYGIRFRVLSLLIQIVSAI